MLTGAALRTALRSLAVGSTIRKRGTFYRATPLVYASDPLGKNRPISAGRFNLKDSARVLYFGYDHNTCLEEVAAFGFPAITVCIVPVEYSLNSVLNLTDSVVQVGLGITNADLRANFRAMLGSAPTQQLGEACAALTGPLIDGFIYESVMRPRHNAVAVFERPLAALGSTLNVDDRRNNLHDSLP